MARPTSKELMATHVFCTRCGSRMVESRRTPDGYNKVTGKPTMLVWFECGRKKDDNCDSALAWDEPE